MEPKKKILFISIGAGLIVFLLGSMIFGNIQRLAQENKSLSRENTSLANKNESLASQLNRERSEKEDYKNRLAEANKELDKIDALVREKEELQKKFNTVSRERDGLAERISKMKAREEPPQPKVVPQAMPGLSDDLYWAGILKEKTNLEIEAGSLRGELRATKIKAEELQKIKETLETELKNTKSSREADLNNLANEKLELERRISYNDRLIDSLSLELVREKKDNRKLKEDYKLLKEESDTLRNKIDSVQKELTSEIKSLQQVKVSLEEKLQKVGEDRSDLERRLIEMNAVLDEKANEILDMKQKLDMIKVEKGITHEALPAAKKSESSVELPPIVVRPAQGKSPKKQEKSKPVAKPAARPETKKYALAATDIPPVEAKSQAAQFQDDAMSGISGKVIEINSSNNFVILDIGEDAGIRNGMKLGVYRGNSRIATLQVIQARKNICAADIRQVAKPIKVGDTVR